MKDVLENFRARDYWIEQNLQYAEPSFRLRKCARIINELAKDRECSLLDVGCGPGALRQVLSPNIAYHGIDIAIHHADSCFREIDFSRNKICFDGKSFDFIVAFGVFEYMGQLQERKFQEIRSILKKNGTFIMSYVNFGHFRRQIWPNYNNVRPIAEMADSIRKTFCLNKCFPASHHWRQKQPGKNALPALQMHLNSNIPIFSPLLAVEYLFICSPQESHTHDSIR